MLTFKSSIFDISCLEVLESSWVSGWNWFFNNSFRSEMPSVCINHSTTQWAKSPKNSL